MPAPKGSRNAAAYQKEMADNCATKISSALTELRRIGALFENVTKLSKHVSEQIGVSDVTLRRNERYRAQLDEYLVSQKGATNLLSPLHQDLTVHRAKVRMLKADIANRDRRIKRLEHAISNMGQSVPHPDSTVAPKTLQKPKEGQRSSEFVQTAHLVLALLEHTQGLIVDTERKSIVDEFGMPGSDVVAGENLAGAFVEWFKKEGVS